MLGFLNRQKDSPVVDDLAAVLVDEPARTPEEVLQRCHAAEALAAFGPVAYAAMPALLRTLVISVSVDCALALRVAVAEAVWKVGGRDDVALPFLVWALKDEYWGFSRKAAEVLGEMGPVAHAAVAELVQLANRRLAHGPFHFEQLDEVANSGTRGQLAAIRQVMIEVGRKSSDTPPTE